MINGTILLFNFVINHSQPLRMSQHLKFSKSSPDFFGSLNKRVGEYFKSNGITRHANRQMYYKTIFMLCLYFVPYALIISGVVTNLWLLILMCVIMGFGTAGIGLSVMHDANHGAYSTKPWINKLLGYSLNLIGGNALNWIVQHNVLHHTYTNIHEADEDISPRGILRMCPNSKWRFFHKFQHIYAWFFYGLLTLAWILFKDFKQIFKYSKDGMLKKQKANIRQEWIILIATKITYISYIFILPFVLLSIAWWKILLGIVICQYIAGFILAIIFQPAHVIEGSEFPLPDDNGNLENNWAIHQLHTTTNFANKSTFFSWFVGGLNYQIEHHLFPNICHVHYKKISEIVRQTAEEFGLPYKNVSTFRGAILSHARLLKELGKRPSPMLSTTK